MTTEEEFRYRVELIAKDVPVSGKQALEALSYITKNTHINNEDIRVFNEAVSTLENFIFTQKGD